MGKIRILADSTCDLSQELIDEYGISIIPLNIILDTKSYLDRIEITPQEIYEWADRHNTTPKTASPELGYVIDTLRPMAEAGDELIYIGISEDMSITCQTIRMAAEELEYPNIFVINSKNLSTGIGLQVLRAAKYAREGKEASVIVQEIEALRDKVSASFVVDTLTYLHRGGRCSSVAAMFGNAIKLKPVIGVTNGKMGVTKKYRGRQNAVVRNYARELEAQLLEADPECVFITHSGIEPEIEQETYDYLKGLNYFNQIYITRAGGVISSHCGPNTLGVLFYNK